MSKRKVLIFFSLGILVGALVMFFIVWLFFQRSSFKNGDEIILEYGDSFIGVPIIDSKGGSADLRSLESDYTIVYYLDKGCGTCLDSLSMISRIEQIYSGEKIANILLWAGEIGDKQAQKKGIPVEYNFTLDHAYISTSTPTYYILDKDMNIIFLGGSMKDIVDKMEQLEILPMIDLANENYIVPLTNDQSQDRKPILVYFSMVGCPDCEAVEPIISSNAIQSAYNVITFYRDRDNVPDEKKAHVDNGGLLANIYNIEWYPSFLIIQDNGEYTLIGETPYEQLEQILHENSK